VKHALPALALLAASACTTTTAHLAESAPFEVVHSQKPRVAVADCLLDRVTSDEVIPSRQVRPAETTLAFNGRGLARKPAVYLFVIRDAGAGSTIEVRRFTGASLAAAESCF
jgi:hypothetical protein